MAVFVQSVSSTFDWNEVPSMADGNIDFHLLGEVGEHHEID
ncbi:MAG: hypothetical protein R3C09_19510 [Pirellulaceae bacterium]